MSSTSVRKRNAETTMIAKTFKAFVNKDHVRFLIASPSLIVLKEKSASTIVAFPIVRMELNVLL